MVKVETNPLTDIELILVVADSDCLDQVVGALAHLNDDVLLAHLLQVVVSKGERQVNYLN